LIAPWVNFYSNTTDPVVDISKENLGYYETHICDFNLFETTKENLKNQSFRIRGDLYSSVECHGKLNGISFTENDNSAYFGTNLQIDLLVQSFFWIFCISLIPKSTSKIRFNKIGLNIFLTLSLFLIHLHGENEYYISFSENFDLSFNIQNYYFLSVLISIILILIILKNVLEERLEVLINYFPYLFLFIGAYNSFNLNFFLLMFILLGLQSLLTNSHNKTFSWIYLFIGANIFLLASNKNFAYDINFFDVDKLKGFSNSSASLSSLFFWIVVYYLVITGFLYMCNLSENKFDLLKVKNHFLITGTLVVLLGILSARSSLMNFLTYYYLGLNKYGMSTLNSVSGNTWRGIAPSAEGIGEFYSFCILFILIVNVLSKNKILKYEILLSFIIVYGLFKSNNFAAMSSLIVVIAIFIMNYKLSLSKKSKVLLLTLGAGLITSMIFYVTPYSTNYLSKAVLYHGINNAEFTYELPQNQYGLSVLDSMSFGELLYLEEDSSNLSSTLRNFIEIYNSEGDIKNIPNPVTVISAISVPINRSEKWGIFISKYNPTLPDLLFGYGPQQLFQYYYAHPTKTNTGLVLPHSSFLDSLLFFGVIGNMLFLYLFITKIVVNLKNKEFYYLLAFLLLNFIKSDSLLYLNSLILLLFVLIFSTKQLFYYDK
jgi:hypothetical protein